MQLSKQGSTTPRVACAGADQQITLWWPCGTSHRRPPPAGYGAVCMRTALFTDVGIYEACNNKVRYYRKSVMRRVYLGE